MTNKPRRRSIPCARLLWLLPAAFLPLGCDNNPQTATKPPIQDAAIAERAIVSADQEIRNLIEQLAIADHKTEKAPLRPDDEGEDEQNEELSDEQIEALRKRIEDCEKAFQRLSELKEVAFPFLVEHLNDDRPSTAFRNHFANWTVGGACYWNIYFQLQDRPKDYSSYGYSRMGRDGGDHPKPYWEGAPFDDAGGSAKWDPGALVKWLEANKTLSYTEKQIKCLRWLLEQEQAIGASDADSYFENILPLEIRIAERRLEAGEDVQDELDRLRRIRDKKLVAEIPRELLPEK